MARSSTTWKKGQCGNPSRRGYARAAESREISRLQKMELSDAIKIVERRKRKKFLVMCVERSYKDTKMAVAILKKLLPDLKAMEVNASANTVLANINIDLGNALSQNQKNMTVNVGKNAAQIAEEYLAKDRDVSNAAMVRVQEKLTLPDNA